MKMLNTRGNKQTEKCRTRFEQRESLKLSFEWALSGFSGTWTREMRREMRKVIVCFQRIRVKMMPLNKNMRSGGNERGSDSRQKPG